jgi:hypothetical protein
MINYQNIQDSISYFEQRQYKRIETPWTVTESISKLTKPEDRLDWKISNKNKVLVGSAEQGFLYLILKGFLPPGKYQSVSPCFREEIFDLTHSKYFIKNELIITDNVNDITLQVLLNDALWFFAQKLKISNKDYDEGKIIKIIETAKDTYDIEYNSIELGSYGIRETALCRYIYGTACAEPRLSYCQNLKS